MTSHPKESIKFWIRAAGCGLALSWRIRTPFVNTSQRLFWISRLSVSSGSQYAYLQRFIKRFCLLTRIVKAAQIFHLPLPLPSLCRHRELVLLRLIFIAYQLLKQPCFSTKQHQTAFENPFVVKTNLNLCSRWCWMSNVWARQK